LEFLGPVEILLDFVDFGVPPYNADSVFRLPSPYSNFQIFVPAGAWPQTRRDSGGSLKAALLLLPGSLAVPGDKNGPAVFMAPRNFKPLKPVLLSLPFDKSLLNGSVIPALYTYNLTDDAGRGWYQNAFPEGGGYDNASLTAQVSDLSLHASFWIPLDAASKTAGTSTSRLPVILGSVAGSAIALLIAGTAVLFRHKLGLKRYDEGKGSEIAEESGDFIFIAEIDHALRRHSLFGLNQKNLDWSGPETDPGTYDNAAIAADLVIKIGKELRRRPSLDKTIFEPTFEARIESLADELNQGRGSDYDFKALSNIVRGNVVFSQSS
jgi:hypothetical protein